MHRYSICQNNVPFTPKRGFHIYDNPYKGGCVKLQLDFD